MSDNDEDPVDNDEFDADPVDADEDDEGEEEEDQSAEVELGSQDTDDEDHEEAAVRRVSKKTHTKSYFSNDWSDIIYFCCGIYRVMKKEKKTGV